MAPLSQLATTTMASTTAPLHLLLPVGPTHLLHSLIITALLRTQVHTPIPTPSNTDIRTHTHHRTLQPRTRVGLPHGLQLPT